MCDGAHPVLPGEGAVSGRAFTEPVWVINALCLWSQAGCQRPALHMLPCTRLWAVCGGSERVCCAAHQGRGRAARGAAALRAAAAPGQPGARRGGLPDPHP